MKVLPSTSVSRAPFASCANIGVAIPTPEETAPLRRSIRALLFGPGISVLILVDSSISLPLLVGLTDSSILLVECDGLPRLFPCDAAQRDVLGVEVAGADHHREVEGYYQVVEQHV